MRTNVLAAMRLLPVVARDMALMPDGSLYNKSQFKSTFSNYIFQLDVEGQKTTIANLEALWVARREHPGAPT